MEHDEEERNDLEIEFNEGKTEVIITEISGDNDEEIKSTSSGSIEYVVDEPIISFKNVKSALDALSDNEKDEGDIDTFQYVYTNNEYYNEDYVKNPLLRSISLSKWPNVGFGFKLNRCNEKKFFYINEIIPNSPAESCLSAGDLIVELDEFDNPYEEFNNLNEIEEYLNDRENIHLVASESSNYSKFKLQNRSLKSFSRNCEDIVVVSWNQLKE